jgi:hypothetical protein
MGILLGNRALSTNDDPRHDWDDCSLRSLMGRIETQRFELKGPLNPTNRNDRKNLAERAFGYVSCRPCI